MRESITVEQPLAVALSAFFALASMSTTVNGILKKKKRGNVPAGLGGLGETDYIMRDTG